LGESKDYAAVFNAALDAIDSGESETAHGLLTEVVTADPNDTEAVLMLARLERERTGPEVARALLESTVARMPTWDDGLVELADILLEQGDPGAAAGCCRQVLERNPNQWEALFVLGNAFLDVSAWPEAMKAHSACVEAHPFFADAWHNLGRAAQGAGDIEHALTCYQTYLRLAPASDDVGDVKDLVSNLVQELEDG